MHSAEIEESTGMPRSGPLVQVLILWAKTYMLLMSHGNVNMQLRCSFNIKQALKCRLLAPLKIHTRVNDFLKEDMVLRPNYIALN